THTPPPHIYPLSLHDALPISFCPLFRAHGRTWKLRLPWGWNTGDPGPVEIKNYGGAAIPDNGQLHNHAVEPICRNYLELRYRLRSEEHTSELQSRGHLVCRLL